jgi:hypothetical protein
MPRALDGGHQPHLYHPAVYDLLGIRICCKMHQLSFIYACGICLMAFTETLKLTVKRKAHFSCCLCHSLGVEVHHIVPQAEGGPDTEDHAAPFPYAGVAADRFAREIMAFLTLSSAARSRRLIAKPLGGSHQRL